MAMCQICRRNLLAGERFRSWRYAGRDSTVCLPCEPSARKDGWVPIAEAYERVSVNGLSGTVRRVA
jgi:hypothetical protein